MSKQGSQQPQAAVPGGATVEYDITLSSFVKVGPVLLCNNMVLLPSVCSTVHATSPDNLTCTAGINTP